MSEDFSSELRDELLDDFYAECDELLANIRDGLTQLEGMLGQPTPDPAVLEALFRHVHSLKGISAIADLRPAEELAHGMEDLLRAISKRLAPATPENVDALLEAAQRLEQIATQHRLKKPLPEMSDVLERLRKLAPSSTSAPVAVDRAVEASAPKANPVAAARARGLKPWLATFSPSPALDQRGVNLKSIRERLTARGEILGATPSVRGKGSIIFEFVVALREDPVELPAWETDGVRFGLLPESSAPVEETKPTAGGESHAAESLTPSHIVRVDLARLDDLMRITGELVIHRSRLEERIGQPGAMGAGLKDINHALARSLKEMREAITRVRMVPLAEIFNRMPFVVRDLARASEKKARVVLEGHQTEIDKYLVERLKEPLLHLVRNAFAHGIESPAERARAGKPPEATILLRAESEGESVVIRIRDDGRGVDAGAVAQHAAAIGVTVPAPLDAAGLLQLLCTPGFSTRAQADLAAGRGVGMAAVATTVRELGGTLLLKTELGRGTEFILRLPLTLSIADAILVVVGPETCAVPQGAVNEIVQAAASAVRTIQQTEVIPYRGALLPLVRLRATFRLPAHPTKTITLLVVRTERGAVGLVVDQVRGQREIVIRPLADPLLRVPGISGATELGDGRPILILDPGVITQGVVRPPQEADRAESHLATTHAS